ncbi:hypothetical protein [Brachybacterium hainanense]|uniref:DUF4389 domain-containing protein n=1 Tax=Brachybacterium hainanense TaxID=1541174 RepID=A0ABV6RBV3_9MICO
MIGTASRMVSDAQPNPSSAKVAPRIRHIGDRGAPRDLLERPPGRIQQEPARRPASRPARDRGDLGETGQLRPCQIQAPGDEPDRLAAFYVIMMLVILALHLLAMIAGLLLALLVPERPHVLRPAITTARFALSRGESTSDHGPDLLQPARPARAAIDVHRRWLRGDLSVRG